MANAANAAIAATAGLSIAYLTLAYRLRVSQELHRLYNNGF
jgi:hypothetical protein